MTRVVSLYLPTWPTDRFRRKLGASGPPADVPIVMFGRQGRRREILALDDGARQAGLRIGMPASKAQVLVPGLVNIELEPSEDAAALDRLALWALRYAPIVSPDPPDGLIIDTSGADHLHGGEEAMLTNLISRMKGSGVAARAAVAESWGAAHAAARFLARPIAVIPSGQAATAIRDLPIRALRLPTHIVEGLHVLGFERIGDIEDTPKAPLTHRFGPELMRRLDQAMGLSVPPSWSRFVAPLASRSAPPRRSRAIRPSWSISSASPWKRGGSVRDDSTCCFIASITASRRSASARPRRCAKRAA
jgi:protein ImuB